MRFKCVSKSWNSLISDPFFVKMHLIKSSRNPHTILSPIYFSCASYIALLNPFLIHSLLQNPSIKLFNHDSKYKFMERISHIIGSCNGLICLASYPSYPEINFYLWNPATRSLSQKLASFHHGRNSLFKFSFGYDNLTNKYKVLAFRPNKVRVFTIGDNVWRNVQSFPTDPHEYSYTNNYLNAGVYLNNSLNWFALRDNTLPRTYYSHRYLNLQQFVIISLDLEIETYTQFLFPEGFDQVPVLPPIVCVLMECLCFSHYSTGFNFVIWQMKEFGVQESWTKLLKLDYQNLVQSDSYEFVNLSPLHVFENGDTLILASNLKQLICYNRRENRVVKQTTVTDMICWISINHYVESLLSTC